MHSFSWMALAYLSVSLLPLNDELAASCTYLLLLKRLSVQEHSHVTVGSWRTLCQAWPGTEHTGGHASSLMFSATDSGEVRSFSRPVCGCAPRPRNSPGGL